MSGISKNDVARKMAYDLTIPQNEIESPIARVPAYATRKSKQILRIKPRGQDFWNFMEERHSQKIIRMIARIQKALSLGLPVSLDIFEILTDHWFFCDVLGGFFRFALLSLRNRVARNPHTHWFPLHLEAMGMLVWYPEFSVHFCAFSWPLSGTLASLRCLIRRQVHRKCSELCLASHAGTEEARWDIAACKAMHRSDSELRWPGTHLRILWISCCSIFRPWSPAQWPSVACQNLHISGA